jgi:hypothetical protein
MKSALSIYKLKLTNCLELIDEKQIVESDSIRNLYYGRFIYSKTIDVKADIEPTRTELN